MNKYKIITASIATLMTVITLELIFGKIFNIKFDFFTGNLFSIPVAMASMYFYLTMIDKSNSK